MQSLQLNGNVVVKRESSPLSDLELRISSYGGLRSVVKQEEDQTVFTAAQIQELYIQVAIFRYILSGLPVPIHLVVPLWKSVASSLGADRTGIYGHFPSLATVFGVGDFDCWSMMDTEPGRCRRTDGKKWRCYKEVVPHQKYCERHMHRGSRRSRKHVETSEDASKSITSAINAYDYTLPLIVPAAVSADSRAAAAVSTNLDLTVPCSNTSKNVAGTFKDGFSSHNDDGYWKSKGKSIAGDKNGGATGSLIRVLADKKTTKYESNYSNGEGVNNFNHIITSKMVRSSDIVNNKYTDTSFPPGFGLSPKSVLQNDKATVCTRLNLDCKTLEEAEPTRCRRSDGRKWRCRRDVVPDKKYCEIHQCRGSKKATLGTRMAIGTPVSIPHYGIIPSSCTMPAKVEHKINLNTDLSISMAAASPRTRLDTDSSSFSSSDATTVTDENASISPNLTLSP